MKLDSVKGLPNAVRLETGFGGEGTGLDTW